MGRTCKSFICKDQAAIMTEPKPRELLVMAVTRLGTGVCVACVERADPGYRWIRPTREQGDWRQLEADDLLNSCGEVVVQVGNVLSWPLGNAMPREVHLEDVFTAGLAEKVRTLSAYQFQQTCGRLCEEDFRSFLSSNRSLILVRPHEIQQVHFERDSKGNVAARIRFRHGNLVEDYGVTDLAWRSLGQELLGACHRELKWTEPELKQHTGLSIRWLAVGRGQRWKGAPHPFAGCYWPFTITVLTDPPNNMLINYDEL